MKILLGIPNYRCVLPSFLDCTFRLAVHLGRQYGGSENKIGWYRDEDTYLHARRNSIFRVAKEQEADYLLFIDSDMLFTPRDFDLLMTSQMDIVSGLYFVRAHPPSKTFPCAYKKGANEIGYTHITTYPKESLYEVDTVGMGFCLISRNVLSKLDEPFDIQGKWGEDFIFCKRAQAAGFRMWVHTGASLGHVSSAPLIITENDYVHPAQGMSWPVGLETMGAGTPGVHEISTAQLQEAAR